MTFLFRTRCSIGQCFGRTQWFSFLYLINLPYMVLKIHACCKSSNWSGMLCHFYCFFFNFKSWLFFCSRMFFLLFFFKKIFPKWNAPCCSANFRNSLQVLRLLGLKELRQNFSLVGLTRQPVASFFLVRFARVSGQRFILCGFTFSLPHIVTCRK